MTAEIIDGKKIAAEILEKLRPEITKLQPSLTVIRANADAGSSWYAKVQARHCAENGVIHRLVELSETATAREILAAITQSNNDSRCSAIMLLQPLPKTLTVRDHTELLAAIYPAKDAEGIHPENLGKLFSGDGKIDNLSAPAPCTAVATVLLVRETARRNNLSLAGKKAVVVGRSAIVGKSAALFLLGLNATVTIAHSHSDLFAACRDADILIAATGAAGIKWQRYQREVEQSRNGERLPLPDLSPLIKAEMIKPGAIMIDVGVNEIPRAFAKNGEPVRDEKGRAIMDYVGDVDLVSAREIAGFITEAKGGVGPVTNAILLQNTVRAARIVSAKK